MQGSQGFNLTNLTLENCALKDTISFYLCCGLKRYCTSISSQDTLPFLWNVGCSETIANVASVFLEYLLNYVFHREGPERFGN